MEAPLHIAHGVEARPWMRIRLGPNLSFAASCGPIEALRGDYDGDEINIHLPQGSVFRRAHGDGNPESRPHVVAELKHLLAVDHQVVTGQSGAPVVRLIQDAVAVAHWSAVGVARPSAARG